MNRISYITTIKVTKCFKKIRGTVVDINVVSLFNKKLILLNLLLELSYNNNNIDTESDKSRGKIHSSITIKSRKRKRALSNRTLTPTIMPLFGKKDSGKKPKKDTKDPDKQPSIEDKYHLKELLGT